MPKLSNDPHFDNRGLSHRTAEDPLSVRQASRSAHEFPELLHTLHSYPRGHVAINQIYAFIRH